MRPGLGSGAFLFIQIFSSPVAKERKTCYNIRVLYCIPKGNNNKEENLI